MSNKYKHADEIPTEVIVSRLKELAKAVTKGPDEVRREFTMRVPAERDRDADLVLMEAAQQLEKVTEERDLLARKLKVEETGGGSIYLCRAHGGIGFQNDCAECLKPIQRPE